MGEVFSQNILKNPDFKGLEFGNHHKKVASYADDTAVPISSKKDLGVFLEVIGDFERATAMKVNHSKSEVVLLGRWRDKPPNNLPYAVKDKVVYLGCEVGNITADDLKRTYAEMEAKIAATFTRWGKVPGGR